MLNRGSRGAWMVFAGIAAVLAVKTMTVTIPQALWGTGFYDGLDAAALYRLTRAWFAAEPLYSTYHRGANYPPATWFMLWPAFGGNDFGTARTIWALATLVAIATLAIMCAWYTDVRNQWARACLFLAPFSMPAVAHVLQVGQTTMVALSLAVAAVVLARGLPPSWARDTAAALLFVLALVKPSCTVPLFWVFFFTVGGVRPAILVVVGYLLVTAASASFQPEPLLTQIAAWLARSERMYARGYGSLPNLAYALHMPELAGPLALAALLALGAWVWHYRHVNIWTLMAVAAIVARLWIYHRLYDDALLMLAIVAVVLQAVNSDVSTRRRQAAAVLSALVAVQWLPLDLDEVGTASAVLNPVHVAMWLATLGALLYWTALDARAGRADVMPALAPSPQRPSTSGP